MDLEKETILASDAKDKTQEQVVEYQTDLNDDKLHCIWDYQNWDDSNSRSIFSLVYKR